MQKILLSLVLTLLSLEATRAASLPPQPAAVATAASYPKPHVRFKERKGTMGFVYGLVLGPVGYFGVKIFSRHNEIMCYKAGRGFGIWLMLIGTCVIIAGSALLFPNGEFPSNLLTAFWGTP
jgi:hypothetical protein